MTKITRNQKRINELGTRNPKCIICGEEEIAVLSKVSRKLLEEHHIAGGHEGESVIVCRKCHPILTDEQLDWPKGLLVKRRSWRVKHLAFLCGIANILKVYAQNLPEIEDGLRGFNHTCRKIIEELARTLELQALAFIDREERQLAWKTVNYLQGELINER